MTGCHASAPPLWPEKLPPAIVGIPYTQTLETVGATSDSLSWAVRPQLPEGLMLVPSTKMADPMLPSPRAYAELRGVPSKAGSYVFDVSAAYKFPTMCSVQPAQRSYEFVIAPADDADAGVP